MVKPNNEMLDLSDYGLRNMSTQELVDIYVRSKANSFLGFVYHLNEGQKSNELVFDGGAFTALANKEYQISGQGAASAGLNFEGEVQLECLFSTVDGTRNGYNYVINSQWVPATPLAYGYFVYNTAVSKIGEKEDENILAHNGVGYNIAVTSKKGKVLSPQDMYERTLAAVAAEQTKNNSEGRHI